VDNTLDRIFYPEGEYLGGVASSSLHDLAGPLIAVAVVLPKIDVHKDDLTIFSIGEPSNIKRPLLEKLSITILECADAIGIGRATPGEIDYLGGRRAKELAMARAVAHLKKPSNMQPMSADHLLIADERPIGVPVDIPQTIVPRGPKTSLVLAAASLLVKLYRDDCMAQELHLLYPEYDFANHKGRPCDSHYQALDKYGFIEGVHRIRRWPFVKKDNQSEDPSWIRRRQLWKEKTLDRLAQTACGRLWTPRPQSKLLSLEP
jgi:ribonuclease HII